MPCTDHTRYKIWLLPSVPGYPAHLNVEDLLYRAQPNPRADPTQMMVRHLSHKRSLCPAAMHPILQGMNSA